MAGLDRTDGGLRLRLDAAEVDVVASLAEGLARRLGDGASRPGSDVVLDRLAPPASRGDATADAEVRPMLRDELLGPRADRLQDLAALLRGDASVGGGDEGFDRLLDRPTAMRVVEALNDLRLALAATIGFESMARDAIERTGEHADAIGLMDALAWLQGGLIDYVDADLPD